MRILERGLRYLGDGKLEGTADRVPFVWDLVGLLYDSLEHAPRDFLLEFESLTGRDFGDQVDALCCIPLRGPRLVYSREEKSAP